ncbi:MAG TPA: cation transporter [Gemmatimonadales bacterium]
MNSVPAGIAIPIGIDDARRNQAIYLRAWLLTLVIVGLEVAGSATSGSLALLADVGHVIADTMLAVVPLSIAYATRRGRSYRLLNRLAGMAAALLLAFIGYHIIAESRADLLEGQHRNVRGWLLFLFAASAAGVNMMQHRLLSRVSSLHRHAAHRGLHFHVLTDLFKNTALPVLGALIAFGAVPTRADIYVALAIGGLILVRAFVLVIEV